MVHEHIDYVILIFVILDHLTNLCVDTPTFYLGCDQLGPILFR